MLVHEALHIPDYKAYDYNVAILRQYSEDYYKIVALRKLRKKGYEETEAYTKLKDNDKGKKNTVCYDEKLPESISRTRARVFELAMFNDWEYFVTLTIDAEKCDRKNLDGYHKKLSKWINNLKTNSGLNVKYLLIPEQHKNGAWHIHGLIMGLPAEYLTAFSLKDKLPHKMRNMIKNGRVLYNWNAYADKFGFVSMERVRNKNHCAKYITKYMTKQANTTKIKPNEHMYYPSKGLKRSVLIYKGNLIKPFKVDYTPTNDYVRVKVFTNIDDAVYHLCDDNEGDIVYPSIWSERVVLPPIKDDVIPRKPIDIEEITGFHEITDEDTTDLSKIFNKPSSFVNTGGIQLPITVAKPCDISCDVWDIFWDSRA